LGEQAEPREVDELKHKLSKLVLQLGSNISVCVLTALPGFVAAYSAVDGCRDGSRRSAGRGDEARQLVEQIRHLERLAEAGRAAYSRGSTPAP
jgi:hypothetical protein